MPTSQWWNKQTMGYFGVKTFICLSETKRFLCIWRPASGFLHPGNYHKWQWSNHQNNKIKNIQINLCFKQLPQVNSVCAVLNIKRFRLYRCLRRAFLLPMPLILQSLWPAFPQLSTSRHATVCVRMKKYTIDEKKNIISSRYRQNWSLTIWVRI